MVSGLLRFARNDAKRRQTKPCRGDPKFMRVISIPANHQKRDGIIRPVFLFTRTPFPTLLFLNFAAKSICV